MLEKILADLNSAEGVSGSLVAGKDGLIISERAPEGVDTELASAMASTLFGTGEKTTEQLKQGDVTQCMIEGTAGKTLIIAGKEAILMAMTEPDVNLGLVRIEMKRCIKEIEESL